MVRGASACLGVREDEGDATAVSHATELRCELVACWLHVSPRVSVAGGSVIWSGGYQPYRARVQRACGEGECLWRRGESRSEP